MLEVEARIDPLDLEVVQYLRNLGGSAHPELFEEIVGIFLTGAQPRMDAVHRALLGDDLAAAAQAIHSMRGSCRMVGAGDLADQCAAVERRTDAGDLKAARQMLGGLEVAFEQAVEALNREQQRGAEDRVR